MLVIAVYMGMSGWLSLIGANTQPLPGAVTHPIWLIINTRSDGHKPGGCS